jgi:hypothetical protein
VKFLNGHPSEVLTPKHHKEMLRELKTKNPEIIGFTCLLRLYGEYLSKGDLKNHQRQLRKQFVKV